MDHLNFLRHLTEDRYVEIWTLVFETVLYGFWARFLAVLFLVLAIWFWVVRRRFRSGIAYFTLAVTITYAGGVIRLFNLLFLK